MQGTLDKRTELLSVKYNQSFEGGKGLFDLNNTRNQSIVKSNKKYDSEASYCDENSIIAEPTQSRESSLGIRGRQVTP